MKEKSAQLTIDGQNFELPVYSPTVGPDVIDVGELTSLGYHTYDPGYLSTASCESSITYIDGDEGILRHRGYPIEQLAEKSTFLNVCYLLLHGQLPDEQQSAEFCDAVRNEQFIDDQFHAIMDSLDRDAHPMGVMCSLVGAMSALNHSQIDSSDPKNRMQVAIQLIAKTPILAALVYRHSRGEAFIPPRADLDYSANFLHMMFSESAESTVNPVFAKAMDRIFLLHADHEQNASTSAVRLVGSTDANPFACIAAGIAALWGPSHGGANEAVLEMLDEIADPANIPTFVEKAKDRDDPFRIMGFGHRVYKNYDPRAKVLQEDCREVLSYLGIESDRTLQMAKELERIALSDEYFIQRRLYPNVDFYSGIIQKALGVPTNMFTVVFAIGRTPGWIAQWIEMVSRGYKIARPRQLYTGEVQRDYTPDD